MNEASNHRQFCWQQIDAIQPLFRISHVFAPPELSERLFALYAFFSAIESVTTAAGDEAVALRKLDWWQQEMARIDRQRSAHPIVAELQGSGAAERIPRRVTEELLLNAASRLDATAPGSISEFEALCDAHGRAQVQIEMAVCGAGEGGSQSLGGLPARVGFALLLRDAAIRGNFWWVPLDLLARHGLDRTQLLSDKHQGPAAALAKEVYASDALGLKEAEKFFKDISYDKQSYMHLYLYDILLRKRLTNLKKVSPVNYGERLARTRFADTFTAWRAARRISLSR